MRKTNLATLAVFILFLISSSKPPALGESAEEITLYMGEIKVVAISNPTRIVISNPAIADVTDVSKTQMTLTPKAPGETSFILWDNFGEQSFQVKVFSEDMQLVKRRVDNLLSRLNLSDLRSEASDQEGKVIISGSVKTPQDKEKIALALGPLKDKTLDLIEVKDETIVEIDVQVLELSKDALTSLGLTNPLSTSSGFTITEPSTSPPLVAAKWSELFRIVDLKRAAYSWTLFALAQEGKVKILSQPKLACQSGKEAELLVGGEKPIFETEISSAGGGSGTSVEYKEYGIKLNIKPTVLEDEDRIKLALNMEISEPGTVETIGTTTTSGSTTTTSTVTARAYPFTKRNASTELILNDEQVMAIGGLRKEKTEEDTIKTPGLGDIPILGIFFRKKESKRGGGAGERGETDLYIMLTPKIVSASPKGKEKVLAKTMDIVSDDMPSGIKAGPLADEPAKGYASIVQRRIMETLSYPYAAKQAGFQGTVKLSLHLSYRGELLEVAVKQSSGYKLLDDNALANAKSITSYPPFPSSITKEDLWIDIPVVYRLN
ncbi:MAG: TonB family protein [Candidatus Omnitrophota bacterium]